MLSHLLLLVILISVLWMQNVFEDRAREGDESPGSAQQPTASPFGSRQQGLGNWAPPKYQPALQVQPDMFHMPFADASGHVSAGAFALYCCEASRVPGRWLPVHHCTTHHTRQLSSHRMHIETRVQQSSWAQPKSASCSSTYIVHHHLSHWTYHASV